MTKICAYNMAELLPHGAPAIMIDKVVDWDKTSVKTSLLIRPGIPLFETDTGVPAHAGIEYMAQTCGAFVGLIAKEKGEQIKLGFLLGTRNFKSSVAWFTLGTILIITAQEVFNADNLGCFSCRIYCNDEEIASAELNVYQPDDPSAILNKHRENHV